MIQLNWLYMIFILIFISSCIDEHVEPFLVAPALMEIPKGFDDISFPDDNLYSEARWELGKKLFYDPVMSLDSTISCATCHKSELAFSDDVSLSLGVEDRIGTQNSPTLANVAYHPYYTREGGVPTLEMQILVPIQEHNEFDFNIVLLAERLRKDSTYIKMSLDAYDRIPDAFVISRSIANFERSLISGFSPYDQYIHYNKESALSDAEIRGMNLFFSSKTNCSSCHGGFNFTNYEFENNGLYDEYNQEGRFRITGESDDLAKFKVPSLRNINETYPYMHDGSIEALEEIIEHYNRGGVYHVNKSELIKPLFLSDEDKSDLLNFLKSLTDDSFVNNTVFKKE